MPVIKRYTVQKTVFITEDMDERIRTVEQREQISQSETIRRILTEGLRTLDPNGEPETE